MAEDRRDTCIRIRLFAGLREEAGWSERQWPCPATLTAAELWSALQLPGSLSGVRVAINQRFAAADTP
ncbi:MAG: MoaD/ThiS family protein, partial [Cyanobacteriota bacterium]|nr:MoaD/ThiS family protein [Cyanobacteriota bacterium]